MKIFNFKFAASGKLIPLGDLIFNSENGQSLIELIVTIGLAAIILPALLTGFVASRSGRAQGEQRQQAVALVKEGLEAARVYREADWTTFANKAGVTLYYPCKSLDTWSLCTQNVDNTADTTIPSGFKRIISVSNVWRDSNFKIVDSSTSGAYNDGSTKLVTTTVSWSSPLPSSVTASEYLTRTDNSTFTDTSVSDFTSRGTFQATFTSTQATSPSGNNGEVGLQFTPGGPDWCSPGTPVATTDLGGNGLAGSVVAGQDRAFVGTGQNASSHPFYNVTINNTSYPPVPNVSANGYYDTNGLKSNDVFGETNYAYLATSHNGNRWVVILDVTSNPPSLVSTIASQNNNDATSIFVENKILYFTAGNVLYRYDVSNPATPVAKGTFTLNAPGNKIYVLNSIVYVALGSTTNQLQIIDASDPTTMKNPGGGSAILVHTNNQPAKGIFVVKYVNSSTTSYRAYLVTSIANPDFFIIKVDSPSSPSVVGSGYSTGTMDPKGLTVIDERAILVGFTSPQYQVLKIKDSNGNDIYSQCAAVTEPADIYNVSSEYANGHAYSYIVTTNTSSAFQIIAGGPGGVGGYATSGSYQSATFGNPNATAPESTAFYRADVTVNKPVGTDITFQVGIAPSVGGSCTGVSYTFVGPTGSTSNFTTGASDGTDRTTQMVIPFPQTSGFGSYINPGYCFAYKADFTGTITDTPYLKDVTITYSP